MDKHDGDCTIYAALCNGRPEDGICTCGFGRQQVFRGDRSEMYSEALQQKLICRRRDYHLPPILRQCR